MITIYINKLIIKKITNINIIKNTNIITIIYIITLAIKNE